MPKSKTGHRTSTDGAENLEDSIRLGIFVGFELLQEFVPRAAASNRAVVFVHAKPRGSSDAAFTQMTSVKTELVEGRTRKSIERLLTFDAVRRVKRRILARSFKRGKIYTAELTAIDLDPEI